MRTAKIRNTNQDFVSFVRENFGGLAISNIWIGKDIFNEIWDNCEANKGSYKIVQPQTHAKHNPFGIYCFSYNETRNDKKEPVFIVLGNYGLANSRKKQFKVCKIETKNMLFQNKNSIFAPNIYIERQKVQSNEKEV